MAEAVTAAMATAAASMPATATTAMMMVLMMLLLMMLLMMMLLMMLLLVQLRLLQLRLPGVAVVAEEWPPRAERLEVAALLPLPPPPRILQPPVREAAYVVDSGSGGRPTLTFLQFALR